MPTHSGGVAQQQQQQQQPQSEKPSDACSKLLFDVTVFYVFTLCK